MANPTCAPYTDIPLYVNRSAGETDEDMLAAVQRQAAKDVRGNYNNTDAKNAERSIKRRRARLPTELLPR